MASRTITTLTDDIDGGDADETVTFTFNGTQYEIDLSKKNLDKMVKALQPYTTAARKSGGRRSGTGRSTNNAADRDQLAKIREWARANGHQVSDRGRSAPPSKRPTTRRTDHRRQGRPFLRRGRPNGAMLRPDRQGPGPALNKVSPSDVETRYGPAAGTAVGASAPRTADLGARLRYWQVRRHGLAVGPHNCPGDSSGSLMPRSGDSKACQIG